MRSSVTNAATFPGVELRRIGADHQRVNEPFSQLGGGLPASGFVVEIDRRLTARHEIILSLAG
jgi:hypothetical protein